MNASTKLQPKVKKLEPLEYKVESNGNVHILKLDSRFIQSKQTPLRRNNTKITFQKKESKNPTPSKVATFVNPIPKDLSDTRQSRFDLPPRLDTSKQPNQFLSNMENPVIKSIMDDNTNLEIPAAVKLTPKPHQMIGVKWLMAQEVDEYHGGILADEMGLGKTFQMTLLMVLRPMQTLIVVPVSVLWQWNDEIKKAVDGMNIQIYYGPNRLLDSSADIVLTTYNTLNLSEELISNRWGRVILDEAHCIRNHLTLSAKCCFKLIANFRWLITGTPIQNTASDSFAYFVFLRIKGFNVNLKIFKQLNLKVIQEQLKSIMLRRTKDDVDLKLPPINTKFVEIEFSKFERKCYDEMITKKNNRSRNELFTLLIRLKQLCNHVSLVPKVNAIQNYDFDSDIADMMTNLNLDVVEDCCWTNVCLSCSCTFPPILFLEFCNNCSKKVVVESILGKRIVFSSKIDAVLLKIIENISKGLKTIIFSQYTASLQKLEDAIQSIKSIAAVRFDGSMPVEKRRKVLNEFKKGSSNVLTASIKATSVGLNVTEASQVIFLDLWWNPSVDDQAVGRVHRLGQIRNVEVTKFYTKNTIEPRILRMHKDKRKLSDQLVKKSLTEQEMSNLLYGSKNNKSNRKLHQAEE